MDLLALGFLYPPEFPLPVLVDYPQDLVRVVGDFYDGQILRRYGAVFQHGIPHKGQHRLPVLGAEEYQGKRVYLQGLYNGKRLEEFVKGAEAARHADVSDGVFYEHDLSDEEVSELKRLALKRIRLLLLGTGYVQAEGFSPS